MNDILRLFLVDPPPGFLDIHHRMKDRGEGRDVAPDADNLAIHHTVSGGAFYGHDNPDLTVEQELAHISMIEQYHISVGYVVFGYHGITFASGRSYLCGKPYTMRSHVASRNHELFGWALAGNFTDQMPTPAALAAMRRIVAAVAPPAVAGHGAWALPEYPTSCPGATLAASIADLVSSEPMPDPGDLYKDSVGTVYVYGDDGLLHHVVDPHTLQAIGAAAKTHHDVRQLANVKIGSPIISPGPHR